MHSTQKLHKNCCPPESTGSNPKKFLFFHCPLDGVHTNMQGGFYFFIMGYTFGGSAPAYILAVYPCSDSPTIYSVLVGIALSLHFQTLILCPARVGSSGNPIICKSLIIGNSEQYFLWSIISRQRTGCQVTFCHCSPEE